jgi:hypothetical protein
MNQHYSLFREDADCENNKYLSKYKEQTCGEKIESEQVLIHFKCGCSKMVDSNIKDWCIKFTICSKHKESC